MQLKEIEEKLQKSTQTLLELNFRRKAAQDKIDQLLKELDGVTELQLIARGKALEAEAVALAVRVNEIETVLNGSKLL